jgi:ABC-type Fe3+-hydroxamate transport system substrate-binding protein
VGGTKDVNIEKIRRLAPTHVIVNIDENEKPTVDLLAGFVPHVVVTHPNAPRDNLALARLMGGIFGAKRPPSAGARPSRPSTRPARVAAGAGAHVCTASGRIRG